MSFKTEKPQPSKVYLIGCGIGDAELLSVKALSIFKKIDVALYDHLITDEILSLLPSNVEKVYVGKIKGAHSSTQDEINALLLAYAANGKVTARLKSGDPFVFSRGAEEAAFLQSHDVPVEVVCGISSAIAAPAAAGIAVTLRGVSAGFSVVSACLAKNEPYFDWVELLKVPKHTTVTLMGSALASQISKIAIEEGVDAALPVAIVSNASRPNQKTKITDIRGLADFDGIIERPAVLVFGNTVLHRVGLAG